MKRRYFDIKDTTMSDKPQVIPPLIINSSIPSTSEPPSATSVDEKPKVGKPVRLLCFWPPPLMFKLEKVPYSHPNYFELGE